MIVIYDLDKTSLFCPIADFMDRFIPKNKFLKKLYYKLYPFIHILEMKLNLLRINTKMYVRAKQYEGLKNVLQVVITARHRSFSLYKHVKHVFRDVDVTVFAIAQGLTNLHKVDIVDKLPMSDDEEIVMYDDNIWELNKVAQKHRGRFTGINLEFKDREEILSYVH